MTKKKLRYAVVGLGYIAQEAVLPAFRHSKYAELTALVSGEMVKLKKLGKKYKVKNLYHYRDYDELLKSGLIDAVYIALPNNMHREYTERAALAGIHVLCEKPMAMNVADCESMVRVAEECKVRLMIAYRLHFEEANLSAIDLVQKKKRIGEPRIFSSVFTIPVKEGNIRLDRELGGGPIYDIGIYCINAARYLFREEPSQVLAVAGKSGKGQFKEVEETVSVILKFSEGRLAQFTCSFGAAPTAWYQIVGTKGDLCVDDAYEYTTKIRHTLTVGGKTVEKSFRKRDQFAPELDYFAECVLKKREPEPNGVEGYADLRVIQAILRSLQTGQPVFLDRFERGRRPGLEQEISRPPVQKPPKLVEAEEPTKKAA